MQCYAQPKATIYCIKILLGNNSNDYLIVHGDDIDANITFKMLILKHRWEKCYNDIMRFGEDLFQEVLRFCKENKYERDRILFCLRNKNYPSGFSFNEFKETLNEQTAIPAHSAKV